MKDIATTITAIIALLAKPKSEKIGILRQLRKTLKKAKKTYWKASRKFKRKGIDEAEKEQLKQLWDYIIDLQEEIININN